MFAPSPIQIRYGDNGLLGQAAAGIGMNEGRQSSMQQAVSMALQQQSQINQQAQQQQQMALEARKLQMAQQLSLQKAQGATPTSGNYSIGGNSPFNQSIIAAKRLTRNTVLGDLTPTDQEQTDLDRLQNDPNVGVNDFESLAGKIASSHRQQAATAKKDADSAAEMQRRSDFVNAAHSHIDPEDADAIQQMAADKGLSANELHTAVQKSAQKKQQKDAINLQQQTKMQLWASAAGVLSPEDQQVLGPAVADPKVTTEQLQMAVQSARSRSSIASRQKSAQQLTSAQHQIAEIEHTNPDIDFSMGPQQFVRNKNGQQTIDNDGLATFQQWQQLHQQVQQLSGAGQQQSGSFVRTATNPQTGHQIGQLSSGQWVDAQTGQPIQ